MQKILITGIAGLLGSHFSRFLLKKGYEVIGIDDFSGGYEDFIPNHKNLIYYKNTLGEDDISKIFEKHKPDVVFHFAAYAAEGLSPFIRCFNYKNNIIASSSIINECIKNDCKLIFTSSMAVYGNQEAPFIEDINPQPIDPYGIAKYAVEMDLKSCCEQFGLKYNIVRPHNVLGIYQNIWDKYRNVIGIFIYKTITNDAMLVYGDGEQTRAFSDIEYYMEPFEKLINNFDGETFNIGADKYWSINQVAEIVKKIGLKYGYNPVIEYKESRHEVKHAFCDHTKAKSLLEFKDNTSLENLIDKMFLWAKDQPKRNVKKMLYEVEKNIYSFWK
jgi:UDP-glucose 4-epimerase